LRVNVTGAATLPVVVLKLTLGLTVKLAVAWAPLVLPVAITEWVPRTALGTLKLPEPAPLELAVNWAYEVIVFVLSHQIRTFSFAAKLLQLTVTVEPTAPLVGLSVQAGVAAPAAKIDPYKLTIAAQSATDNSARRRLDWRDRDGGPMHVPFDTASPQRHALACRRHRPHQAADVGLLRCNEVSPLGGH
jgi:hypothetical protein